MQGVCGPRAPLLVLASVLLVGPCSPSGRFHGPSSTEREFVALESKVDRMAALLERQAETIAALRNEVALHTTIARAECSRVSVLEFGADPSGKLDSTKAIQAALDSFSGRGGVVDVPSGRFACHGELTVPPSVTLLGSFRSTPTHAGPFYPGGANLSGSVLEVYGGKGKVNGTAFITLNSDSTLEGVVIFYPEQVMWPHDSPTGAPLEYPFAVAMRGEDPAVLSCELHNPYQGIDASRNIRHNIKDIAGQPLRMGIFVDGVTDIGRIENVHFHASIFSFGLANWTMNHGTCFKFGRSDWEYVFNTFCWGWRIGYHFFESNGSHGSAGACNGNFLGIGADMVAISVLVEATQPFGLLITNGEFTAFEPGVHISNITDVPTTVLVTPGYDGGIAGIANDPCRDFCAIKVSFVNCAFWGPNDIKVNLSSTVHNSSVADFKDSIFLAWANENESAPCIAAFAGSLTVSGCEFRDDKPQLFLGAAVQRAVVTGNLYMVRTATLSP